MTSPIRSAGFRWFVLAPLMFVVFVVSSLFVSFHLVRAAATPKRDKIVAELDATDPTWRTTALTDARNAKLPPPEQNAAELAHKAYLKLPKSYRDWESKSPAATGWGDVPKPHLPPRTDIAETREQLRKVREAVDMARRLKDVPTGGFHFEFKEPTLLATNLDRQQYLRTVMSVLRYDAAVRAYDRDYDTSLDSCLAILSVARSLGDEPTLISQLIRMAGVAICVGALERTLCWGDGFDDARLAEIDRAFDKESNEPRILQALRGERASYFRMCENIDSGAFDIVGDYSMIGFQVSTPAAWYVKSRIPEEQTVGLEMFNKLIDAAGKPTGQERTASLQAVEYEFDKRVYRRRIGPVPLHPLLNLLMPAISKMQEADTRTVAGLYAARVAIACERHRARTGAYPEKLNELPKDLLSEVPTDPFSGKPILYKKLDDGAVAYSVGGDGVDNVAVKLNPRTEKGNDQGFRLWTPEHRRKPAVPVEQPISNLAGPGAPSPFGYSFDEKPKPGRPTAPEPLSPWVRPERE